MSEKVWEQLSHRKIGRRSMLNWSARAGVGAAGIALVGCGDDDDDAPATAEAPATPAETPAEAPAETPAEAPAEAPAETAAAVSPPEALGASPRPPVGSEGPLLSDSITANRPYKVAIAYPVFDVPFFVEGVHYGAVQECERLGVECVFTFGGGYDRPEAQVNDMEDLIAQDVDGIILTAAVDEALVPVMDKANENGIVVTSFSIDSTSTTFYGFEGISHLEEGVESTKLLFQCLDEKGISNARIIAVGGPKGAAWYDPRLEGLEATLAGTGHELVAHQYTSSAREEAIRVFEDLFTANPDVDAVWTGSADMAMGVIQVLENRGFEPGEVCIVSGASLSDEYATRIREGWYYGNLTQQAVITGQQAIRKLVAHLNGDTSVPYHVVEPFIVITAENVDTVDRSTLLGPPDFDPPSRVAPR